MRTLVDQFYQVEPRKEEFGEVQHTAPDQHIVGDPDLTNYLLNIDTISKDLYQSDGLAAYLRTLESVNERLNTLTFASDQSLDPLIVHLGQLGASIEAIQASIAQSSSKAGAFKGDISKSVDQLNDLLMDLQNLETKLLRVKEQVSETKATVTLDFSATVEVLEYIETRFAGYKREQGKSKLKQLAVGAAVAAVAAAWYLGC